MKKIIAIFLVLCMALTACSKPHTHVESDWNGLPLEHWYICEDCGERIAEDHKLNEEGACEGCGFTIVDNGDGTYNLMGYDAWGGVLVDLWMDEGGALMSELYYDNEYDDQGNLLHSMSYVDGVLVNETFFEVGEEHYLTQEISYDDSGMTVTTYNEHMYATGAAVYDAQGNLISEEEYVYEYDDAGNVTYCASYTNGEMTYEEAELVGPDGNVYTQFMRYYSEGELIGEYSHEYEFADDGNLALVRDFMDGVLAVVGTYDRDDNGDAYLAMEECYDENGEITDVYHYDADGNFIEE